MPGMAVKLEREFRRGFAELRYQPVLKRVRVLRDELLIADTTHPVLVWEPRRVVPSYAVPIRDLAVPVRTSTGPVEVESRPVSLGDGPPVLDPRTGFAVHSAPGEALSISVEGAVLEGAAFRPADPDLRDYIVLDFAAFTWFEEDEPIMSHPRDPFHRIDIRTSSRRVRIEHEGRLLAQTSRANFLFEGVFPMVRYYMPRDDVAVDLARSTYTTTCAYKGHATHWSVPGEPELRDIAWTYEDPLNDASAVAGLLAFYTERLDLSVDDEPVERPITPWSQP
jgi:uncharacterized protein (DUF427 family)